MLISFLRPTCEGSPGYPGTYTFRVLGLQMCAITVALSLLLKTLLSLVGRKSPLYTFLGVHMEIGTKRSNSEYFSRVQQRS